jgi:Putative beta-barrel porin 2
MGFRIFRHWATRGLVIAQLSCASLPALVKFNEGRDQIFVNAGLSVGYDSNIFATRDAVGDIFTNTNVGLDYARKAGLIGVSASAGWNLGTFADNGESDFSNPKLTLDFSKETGRTTGSLSLSSARESEADPNVNLRTESWNHDLSLNWRYRVIERYSLSGTLGYTLLDYIDNSAGFIDLDTYSASVDLGYTYTSTRELFFGYRIRESDTSTGGSTTDHSLTGGINGKILAKLNGSVRLGYQLREDAVTGDIYGGTNGEVSLTWSATKRLSVSLSLVKDFSTTATDSSLDSTQLNLNSQYSLTRRWNLSATVGGGESKFFSGADEGRDDRFLTATTGATFTINEHFTTALTYSYFKNWSNQDNSAFDRHSVTLNLSTNW